MRLPLAFLLILTAFAGGCSRDAAPTAVRRPASDSKPPTAVDLLDLERGASVVSRTAEYYYERSAAHAIDGDVGHITNWVTPPDGPEQTIVIGLAARSRIRRFGLLTIAQNAAPQVRLESSLDGAAWTPIGTFPFEVDSHRRQLHDVRPFEARYLRVHTIAPQRPFSVVGDFTAEGEELEPPHARSIAGCWTINGRAARFTQRGAAVHGVIDPWEGRDAIHIDGGFDGRAYRLMWRSAARIGDAILTVSPDGKAVSGVSRHKNARTELPADGWLGTPGPCATSALDVDSVRRRAVDVVGRYPLYALRFDAQNRLLAADSGTAIDFVATLGSVRLVTRTSAARLTSLREALAARGVDVSKYEFVDRSTDDGKVMPRFYDADIEIEAKR